MDLSLPGSRAREKLRSARTSSEGQDQAVRVEKANRKAVDVAQIIADVQASGASSLRHIAAALNERGIPAARGGEWSAIQVKRAMGRV